MEIGGLAHKLNRKLQTKVLLMSNIDVSDKLCNDQFGSIQHLKQDTNDNVIAIYLKMGDQNAGLRAMRSDIYVSQHNLVPIKRIEKEIARNNKSTCTSVIKNL